MINRKVNKCCLPVHGGLLKVGGRGVALVRAVIIPLSAHWFQLHTVHDI